MKLPETISDAADLLSYLPGVGEKTALRYILNLTTWSQQNIDLLADSIRQIASLSKCQECGFFSDSSRCHICSDTGRDFGIMCIVESVTDCLAVEKSQYYRGLYHVLGGVLNPLLGVGPSELHFDNIVSRIRRNKTTNVILALNPSVEGDATCAYIRDMLPADIKVDRIGFGVPIGGSLEYVDAMTISKALENRQEM